MNAIFLLAAFAACAGAQEAAPPGECIYSLDDWRRHATEEDRARLREWRPAWLEALAQARGAGHQAEVAGEGALLDPDAALPGVLPPPGDYACRTIKIGSPDDLLPYVAYPPFRCRIAMRAGHLSLVKLTGSQRPIGRLFPDTERRMVFLGTMQLGDERRAYEYGADRERNLIGALERLGDRRWRLVFPRPHFESLLDVIELTPVSD